MRNRQFGRRTSQENDELFTEEFTIDEANHRAEYLKERYDNLMNGQKMIGLIYKE